MSDRHNGSNKFKSDKSESAIDCIKSSDDRRGKNVRFDHESTTLGELTLDDEVLGKHQSMNVISVGKKTKHEIRYHYNDKSKGKKSKNVVSNPRQMLNMNAQVLLVSLKGTETGD